MHSFFPCPRLCSRDHRSSSPHLSTLFEAASLATRAPLVFRSTPHPPTHAQFSTRWQKLFLGTRYVFELKVLQFKSVINLDVSVPSTSRASVNLGWRGASSFVRDALMIVECVFIFNLVSALFHGHICAQRARCGVDRKAGPALPSKAIAKGRGSHAGRWTPTES